MGSLDYSEFRILTPCAILGYGFRSDHFWLGVDKFKPAAIIVDAGSTDGGPYKLEMNKMTCGRESYIRDPTHMLEACFYRRIKVLISSAGGDGSNKHVDEMLDIIKEIASAHNFSFKVATITTDISRETIKARILKGQAHPCGPVADLTEMDVDRAVDIVGQMGAEPFIAALQTDPDIILSGRSYDPSPFAGFCLSGGVDPGVAWYLGKIMECGAFCAVPKGRTMVATVRQSWFDLTPVSPFEACTPVSVAAHTLYEKTRPDRHPGPGGVVHLDSAQYELLADGRTVRVSGASFVPTPIYQVKLEGVERLGHRTIFIGGIRDPILIAQIDEFLERARAYTQKMFPELDQDEHCQLKFQVYGKNAVMGPFEQSKVTAHEIGVLGEVVAPTKENSHAIANNVRASILHMPYEGQMATAGNFASPLSPHEQDAGQVFRWNIYHLIDLHPGEELSMFPVSCVVIDCSEPATPEPIHFSAEEPEEFNGRPKPLVPKVVPKVVPQGEALMMDIAKIVRSKNSGPFELTFDIMFDDLATYQRVKSANVLTNDVIGRLYGVQEQNILTNMYFDPAMAWKCTIKRPWEQGSIGERDTLGTQQHAPLLYVKVPAAV